MVIMKLFTTLLFFISFNCIAQDDYANSACKKVIDSLTNKEVYKVADEMPKIEGGMRQLYRQMAKIIKLPAELPIYDTKVIVAFIVEKDGRVTGERVIRNIAGTNIGQELLNMVSQNKWNAGKCDGESVAVIQILPMIIDHK